LETNEHTQATVLKNGPQYKGDDIEDCTHKQRYAVSYQSMMKVLQQNTWIDDRKFLKSCVQNRAEQDRTNQPAYGTWMADFLVQQNESRAFFREVFERPARPMET